jgi:hypothetical protein
MAKKRTVALPAEHTLDLKEDRAAVLLAAACAEAHEPTIVLEVGVNTSRALMSEEVADTCSRARCIGPGLVRERKSEAEAVR